MWNIQVWSKKMTEEEELAWKARWPAEDEICPNCGERFGSWKQVRDIAPDGSRVVVHKKCSDGSYLK